jgi:hypothetical protein
MKKYVWMVAIVVIAIGVGVFGSTLLDTDDTQVVAMNGGTPRLSLSKIDVDLGEMSVQDERGEDIVITNTGDGPLELSRIRTSCGCTIAELTMNGRTLSFNMEMHNPIALKKWSGSVAPGESVTMRTIYRPFVMPVKGSVERKVFFDTNDPENKTATITLQAFVN